MRVCDWLKAITLFLAVCCQPELTNKGNKGGLKVIVNLKLWNVKLTLFVLLLFSGNMYKENCSGVRIEYSKL